MGNSAAKAGASSTTPPSSDDPAASPSKHPADPPCRDAPPPSPDPSESKQEEQAAAEHARRTGQVPDCYYHVKLGSCRFGTNCKFNHPPPKPAAGEKQEGQELLAAAEPEYPRRPGEPDCSHYVRFGSCKFGMNCRYDHPPRKTSAGHEASSSKYRQNLPRNTCKYNNNSEGNAQVEQVKLNFLGLPLRPGTRVCSYYMRSGLCKFGSNCKFHHPEPESRHAIQGSSQLNFSSGLDQKALKEQPVPFLAPSPSPSGVVPPQEVYPCPERSGYDQMDHCLLSELNCGDDNPRICVRLSRFWDFYHPKDENSLLHLGLVLIDETGDSIAAQIFPPCHETFKPILTEGKVYYLTYLHVRPANRMYRPVDVKLSISFTRWTIAEERVDPPADFPLYTYSLKTFAELKPLADKKEFFIDTIAVVTEITSVTSVRSQSRDGDSLKRNVYLRDPNNSTMHIALWGDRATDFPAEEVLQHGEKEPQIIIFVGTLVKGSKGNVLLSGNSACKWYINMDVPEVESLRASAKARYEPIRWINLPPANAIRNVAETKSVIDIKDLHPFIFKKHEFLVTVTINKIQMEGSWWYVVCDICKKKARPYGTVYRCSGPKCPPTVAASPMYRLAVLAGDKTAETQFVLFGRVAQRIVGRPVEALVEENPDREYIPKEITNLLEKEFTWNVSFTDITVSSGNVCFQVNSIQADNAPPRLLLAPSPLATNTATSQSISVTHSNTMGGPTSVFNSPPLTPTKDQLNAECSSKTPNKELAEENEEDEDGPIEAFKSPPTTRHSTTKSSKKKYIIVRHSLGD